MGQYFLVVNPDRKEYLNPHCFGDGLKLMEFGCSSYGTLTGLTLLLRVSDETGGGDFGPAQRQSTGRWANEGDPANLSSGLLGAWAGGRVAIIGDYDGSKLYQQAMEDFRNISHEVIDLMRHDEGVKRVIEKGRLRYAMHCPCTPESNGGGYGGLGALEILAMSKRRGGR